MRNYITVYINGKEHQITGSDIYKSLSNYLRNDLSLKGTKIVCEEGDCGACTVLKAFPKIDYSTKSKNPNLKFEAINSCITYMYLLDCCHIVTVEGIKNQIQEEMVKNNSSQCGFCTPGFVMSLTSLFLNEKDVTEEKVKTALAGNLCRCTGYAQIIDAAMSVYSKITLSSVITQEGIVKNLLKLKKQEVYIADEKNKREFYSPTKIEDAASFKNKNITIVSGATDLGVQINKIDRQIKQTLSLNLIDDLYKISLNKNKDILTIGSKVSINDFQEFIKNIVPELNDFLNIFASKQIKNQATIVGNLVNASPVADTTPFLMVLNTKLKIVSKNRSSHKEILLEKLYLGYKKLSLKEDELIESITIELPKKDQFLKTYKISKRKDLDISAVNAAFLLKKSKLNIIEDIKICYGGVGPTTQRLNQLEKLLQNKEISKDLFKEFSERINDYITPMSDMRGSSKYRQLIAKNLFLKFYQDMDMHEKA